ADQDCAGVCFGDSALDDCGVCDGGNADQDCAGECGGSAVVDECGECGGDGAAEGFDCAGGCVDSTVCGEASISISATSSTSATVSYTSNFDVAGFQFASSGVTLTGASSDLGDTQFNPSTGIVIGFSFTGASLPAGEGALVELTFDESIDGSTLALDDLIVSTFGGV
ncbi:MAG: hypothetical protein QGF36_07235, partial [Candidatus Marinimicrobia bacterium]|nr:hypothetical protein [Candidatus Neomarinimicrobiota bacterium]